MDKLKIFVCGHDSFSMSSNKNFLQRVDLNRLLIGQYQNNQLAETRVFLSNLVRTEAEYIGFVSMNYDAKFTQPNQVATKKYTQRILPKLSNLDQLDLKPNIVYCCILSHVSCKDWFKNNFYGIGPYLDKIEEVFGLSFDSFPPLLSNSFVCHHQVFKEYMKIWRPIFDFSWDQFPIDELATNIKGYADQKRAAGYFYEAISMLVWAEAIKKNNLDLRFLEVPKKRIKQVLI